MAKIIDRTRYQHSMGKKALAEAALARQIKQAKWVLKNMPAALTDEDRALLASVK